MSSASSPSNIACVTAAASASGTSPEATALRSAAWASRSMSIAAWPTPKPSPWSRVIASLASSTSAVSSIRSRAACGSSVPDPASGWRTASPSARAREARATDPLTVPAASASPNANSMPPRRSGAGSSRTTSATRVAR